MDVFIREVRRPTGHPYLPESIYYLCLGIQFYLNLNNRQIDLFDPRYVEFNSTLNKILANYVRGTADVFYLRPINGQLLESSLWFSHEPLSATIIDQILNRLKLLPDFYNQTKPVETNSSTVGYNVTTSQSTTAASTSIS
ncbi:unnamed protein product [Rotaria sp. Silwood1]|nr:unnamed protein product [Rotaria sp. Silwood1]